MVYSETYVGLRLYAPYAVGLASQRATPCPPAPLATYMGVSHKIFVTFGGKQ
jgi:hypothetical protein